MADERKRRDLKEFEEATHPREVSLSRPLYAYIWAPLFVDHAILLSFAATTGGFRSERLFTKLWLSRARWVGNKGMARFSIFSLPAPNPIRSGSLCRIFHQGKARHVYDMSSSLISGLVISKKIPWVQLAARSIPTAQSPSDHSTSLKNQSAVCKKLEYALPTAIHTWSTQAWSQASYIEAYSRYSAFSISGSLCPFKGDELYGNLGLLKTIAYLCSLELEGSKFNDNSIIADSKANCFWVDKERSRIGKADSRLARNVLLCLETWCASFPLLFDRSETRLGLLLGDLFRRLWHGLPDTSSTLMWAVGQPPSRTG